MVVGEPSRTAAALLSAKRNTRPGELPSGSGQMLGRPSRPRSQRTPRPEAFLTVAKTKQLAAYNGRMERTVTEQNFHVQKMSGIYISYIILQNKSKSY